MKRIIIKILLIPVMTSLNSGVAHAQTNVSQDTVQIMSYSTLSPDTKLQVDKAFKKYCNTLKLHEDKTQPMRSFQKGNGLVAISTWGGMLTVGIVNSIYWNITDKPIMHPDKIPAGINKWGGRVLIGAAVAGVLWGATKWYTKQVDNKIEKYKVNFATEDLHTLLANNKIEILANNKIEMQDAFDATEMQEYGFNEMTIQEGVFSEIGTQDISLYRLEKPLDSFCL